MPTMSPSVRFLLKSSSGNRVGVHNGNYCASRMRATSVAIHAEVTKGPSFSAVVVFVEATTAPYAREGSQWLVAIRRR